MLALDCELLVASRSKGPWQPAYTILNSRPILCEQSQLNFTLCKNRFAHNYRNSSPFDLKLETDPICEQSQLNFTLYKNRFAQNYRTSSTFRIYSSINSECFLASLAALVTICFSCPGERPWVLGFSSAL